MVEGEGHVLGLDGGGSGTRCVIAEVSGRLLARGIGGPSNPLTAGADNAARAIMEAVEEASRRCGIRHFAAACMGIAGTDRPSGREAVIIRLKGIITDRLSIVSDAVAALYGAMGCGPGVVVIAGTGSIALGMDEGGGLVRAGGWGWRIGDEGSGYDIGRRAMTAVLRAYDGRGPDTRLSQKVMSALSLKDPCELVDRVYGDGMGSAEVAGLATVVADAAHEGDRMAFKILQEAGVELGLAVSSVIRRLGLEGGFDVAPSGGVFNLEEPLRSSFESVVKEAAPECSIIPPRFEPEVGAVLFALQGLGVEVDEALLERVAASRRALEGDR